MLSPRRPSAATVLAAAALFISLGGVGWAALDRNSVRSKQIKNGAVRSIDVRNDALTGADVAEGRLGVVPEATRAEMARPSGAAAGDLAGEFPAPELAAGSVGVEEQSASLPAAQVSRSSDYEVPANAGLGVPVPFEEEHIDTRDMFDADATSTQVRAPADGVYLAAAEAEWQSAAGGSRSMGIRHNGDLVALDDRPPTGIGPSQQVSAIVRMAAGDHVDMVVEQSSGVPLDLEDIPGRSPELSLVWLTPG